jgi:flagellar FliL protein
MKKNILTVVVIALCLINLALSAVIVFSIVPMANRTNDLITQVASVINLELEDPSAEKITTDVPVADRETLEAIGGDSEITVNLKADGSGSNHVAMYDTITLTVNKASEDYKTVTGLISTNSTYITECVTTSLAKRTLEELQNDTDRSELKADIIQQLNQYFDTDMICDVVVNNLKYQ